MSKGLQFVITLVAAMAIGAGALYSYQHLSEKEAAGGVDRTGMVLVENNRSDSGDNPFIMEAKIASETSGQIIVDLKYFMSDAIGGEYTVSIHPDTGDWAYSPVALRPGINTDKMTVSFRPSNAGQMRSESKLLYIYINHNENNQWKEKAFDRTVDFPKVWMK